MCIAILQTKGNRITKKALKRCWDNNPDGGGILFAYKNTLHSYKQLDSFGKWYEAYRTIFNELGHKIDMVLHFRIGTSGNEDLENCHPHMVNKNLGFVHNGILSMKVPLKSEVSDTVLFNRDILQKLPEGFIENDGAMTLISRFATGSKLIFLRNDGQRLIVHEDDGHWNGGNWYSNTSYTYDRVVYQSNHYSYNKYSWEDGMVYNRTTRQWEYPEYSKSYEKETSTQATAFIGSTKSSIKQATCEICGIEITADEVKANIDHCWNCQDKLDWEDEERLLVGDHKEITPHA